MIFSQVQKELNKIIPELELRLIENKKSKKNIQISIEIKNKAQTQPKSNEAIKQDITNAQKPNQVIAKTVSNKPKSNETIKQTITN
jgi:hypothetical protein